MIKINRTAFRTALSDNRKSKIENLKWLGILVLFAGWVGMAQAQQPAKIPRIGYLAISPPFIQHDPHRGLPARSERARVRGGEEHCH